MPEVRNDLSLLCNLLLDALRIKDELCRRYWRRWKVVAHRSALLHQSFKSGTLRLLDHLVIAEIDAVVQHLRAIWEGIYAVAQVESLLPQHPELERILVSRA